jgi:basic membrane lipoprotein Med (substrate-binding protein (PBP1-ABC) superfamily)
MVTVGGVAVAAAAALTAALLAGGGPQPRARQYLAFTACLLTGPGGLADAQAANAWAGLQKASLATRAKVQYLPVESGTTATAAEPYLASLTTRHCSVVVAVGSAQVGAVAAAAGRYRSVRFAVVGGGASGPNVTDVTGDAASMRSDIAALVTRAVAQSTA